MNYRVARLTSLFIFSFVVISFTEIFAQSDCDPLLASLSSGPSGYKERGDRCEGIYIKEVGSTTLQVASLTETFEQYNLSSGKPLLIEWDLPPGSSTVNLRAQGLRRKLYYRMDKNVPPGKTSYSWPTNFLSSMNIVKSEIGVTARSMCTLNGTKHDVYIPLRISQQQENIKPGNYKLIVLPGTELKEVYISLAPVQTDGHLGKFIIEGKKLGYGYYPAERGIEIPLTGMKDTGLYYLEVSAEKKNGGTSTQEIWFYHVKI